ncbi:MAG TPA: MarR family transcriptional regulator [Methylomirabilota bacterium]|nr:MarR family transcriptional regulator [Methylomirabilota bacterium]
MARSANRREGDVADRLHSAAIHLLRRARRTDPLTGVSPAQLSALSVLMSGPKTLGDLAAAEQVRPPTMSRLVSEMERAGVARKTTDRDDARVLRIRATPKGLRALSRGRAMRIEAIERLLGELNREELSTVERAVGTIEKLLGQRPAPR